ncbi:UNVERIFIED_CONTAM: hypothetical protein K2H54_051969 [Gekko kuhli]
MKLGFLSDVGEGKDGARKLGDCHVPRRRHAPSIFAHEKKAKENSFLLQLFCPIVTGDCIMQAALPNVWASVLKAYFNYKADYQLISHNALENGMIGRRMKPVFREDTLSINLTKCMYGAIANVQS